MTKEHSHSRKQWQWHTVSTKRPNQRICWWVGGTETGKRGRETNERTTKKFSKLRNGVQIQKFTLNRFSPFRRHPFLFHSDDYPANDNTTHSQLLFYVCLEVHSSANGLIYGWEDDDDDGVRKLRFPSSSCDFPIAHSVCISNSFTTCNQLSRAIVEMCSRLHPLSSEMPQNWIIKERRFEAERNYQLGHEDNFEEMVVSIRSSSTGLSSKLNNYWMQRWRRRVNGLQLR